jgi:hypothetical protein
MIFKVRHRIAPPRGEAVLNALQIVGDQVGSVPRPVERTEFMYDAQHEASWDRSPRLYPSAKSPDRILLKIADWILSLIVYSVSAAPSEVRSPGVCWS